MNAESRLRQVLTFNAATSAASAGLALAFVPALADRLNIGTVAVLVAVVLLADWALVTGALARSSRASLARFVNLVAAGDAAWTVASLLLLATGVVDRDAWWVIVAMAVVTADLALAQWYLGRSLVPGTAPARLVTAA